MSIEAVRTTIIWTAAVLAFLAGVGLCIAGFTVPPTGEISGSVLTATGEFLTFFGSVFGIGEFTRIQLAKIREEARGKKKPDDSEEK